MTTIRTGNRLVHTIDTLPIKPITSPTPRPPPLRAVDTLVLNPNPWHLTPQQIRIVELLCEGLGYEQVAQSMGVAIATVNTHMLRMRDRMGARTTGAAVYKWLSRQQSVTLETHRAMAEARLIARLQRR